MTPKVPGIAPDIFNPEPDISLTAVKVAGRKLARLKAEWLGTFLSRTLGAQVGDGECLRTLAHRCASPLGLDDPRAAGRAVPPEFLEPLDIAATVTAAGEASKSEAGAISVIHVIANAARTS